MIHFFATKAHHYTIRQFVESWAPELAKEIHVIPYEAFSFHRKMANGACIFSDLERLLPEELQLAKNLTAQLQAMPDRYTVINAPAHYLGRFQLQQTLHQKGINQFRVFRTDQIPSDLHFPVFLRSDLDHSGPRTALLNSMEELRRALPAQIARAGRQQGNLMIVEYCDCTGTDGLFRKYSALNVAGTLIPRHILFSNDWVTKNPDLVNETTVTEEETYLREFPHAEQIREIFLMAGVGFGRIDYGVKEGRVQVWEINTNPMIVPRREKIHPLRMVSQTDSSRRISATLQDLSHSRGHGSAFPFPPDRFNIANLLRFVQNRSARTRK